jgi:hypothetical protein
LPAANAAPSSFNPHTEILHEQIDRSRISDEHAGRRPFLIGTLGAGLANAAPLAPLAPSLSGDVIAVAGGCGPGFHRGPYGGCLQNYANPGAHACPRGFHIGPNGGCRGNGR